VRSKVTGGLAILCSWSLACSWDSSASSLLIWSLSLAPPSGMDRPMEARVCDWLRSRCSRSWTRWRCWDSACDGQAWLGVLIKVSLTQLSSTIWP
jgi:hypothetical protein